MAADKPTFADPAAAVKTLLGAALFLFGGVLLYDSTIAYVFRLIFEPTEFFGFDLKEFVIGAAAAGVAFVAMRRVKSITAGHRSWLVGLFFIGLLAPLLFSYEISRPHWFTSSVKVAPVGRGGEGYFQKVRSRYVKWIDEKPPEKDNAK